MFFNGQGSHRDLFETRFPHKMHFLSYLNLKTTPNFVHVQVKYVDSIMMLVRLDLNLIHVVSLFQRKCGVTETVSTTTLIRTSWKWHNILTPVLLRTNNYDNCLHGATTDLTPPVTLYMYTEQ